MEIECLNRQILHARNNAFTRESKQNSTKVTVSSCKSIYINYTKINNLGDPTKTYMIGHLQNAKRCKNKLPIKRDYRNVRSQQMCI